MSSKPFLFSLMLMMVGNIAYLQALIPYYYIELLFSLFQCSGVSCIAEVSSVLFVFIIHPPFITYLKKLEFLTECDGFTTADQLYLTYEILISHLVRIRKLVRNALGKF